jgi:ubiquinone/menaquinone biosynthesis C-methylase UbiE
LNNDKAAVAEFWNKASCGEELYLKGQEKEKYDTQARLRYELEPYIPDFADFNGAAGKRVLEIGVGLGADHQKFAEAGAELFGCDLTDRAVKHTRTRLRLSGLHSTLQQADAEALPYQSDFFDVVYSWGVLHHSPDTRRAIHEVHRVLKPEGKAKIMIYHRSSFVGYMLWFRYALLKLQPFTSLDSIYSRYLESPGTKAYSVAEAHELFRGFSKVKVETQLTHGDLLSSSAGQRHKGPILALARTLWPRRFITRFFPRHGLFMLIDAVK